MLAALWGIPALLSSAIHAQTTLASVSSYDQTYPTLAVTAVIRQAVAGDILAQHELSSRLAQGTGIAQNLSAAAYWYSLAASRAYPGSASLDSLRNAPILASSNSANVNVALPTARLTATAESGSLQATVNASASTSSASITRYVWSVANALGADAGVSIGNSDTAQITLPSAGVYYLTVAVVDSTGQIDYVTEKLDVSAPAEPELPAAPDIESPAASQPVLANATVEFQWAQTADASRYQFELLDSASLGSEPIVAAQVPIDACDGALCSVSVLFDFAVYGPLTWRVRAINDTGSSDWVSGDIISLAPRPGKQVNVSPAPDVNLNQGDTVTFVWEEDPKADTYDFHIFNQSDTGVFFNYVLDMRPEEVCSDALCSLPVTLDLPVNNGHAWRVRARNAAGVSLEWSRTSFNIIVPLTDLPEAPALIAPLAGGLVETGTTASFSWTPTAQTTAYDVQILDGAVLVEERVTPNNCDAESCSLTVALTLVEDAEFTWRVRSVNPVGESDWSTDTFITIEKADQRPEPAIHLTPADGADVIENTVATFTWEQDPLVTVYDFHFFNNEPGDDRGELQYILGLDPQQICADGVCSYETLVSLPRYTDHVWRIRAGNSQGKSFWSRRVFNVVELVTDPPIAPAAVSPLPDARLETDTTVTFNWTASPTASRYQVQLLDTADNTLDAPVAFIPATSCNGNACSISLELDLPLAKTYQWQVLAENAAGLSDWTATDFEIIAKATTVPPTPVLVSPENSALVSQNDDSDFVWLRDVHAVTYEFYFFDGFNSATLPATVGLSADELCDAVQCTFTQAVDLPIADNHIWRVRGRNSLGASSWGRSTLEVVDSITSPPGGFELTSPINNPEIQAGTDVTFLWTRAANATRFDFSLVDGTDTENTAAILPINASTCDVDFCKYTTTVDLPASSLHQWQVRAFNSLGQSEWISAPFSVVAEPVELLDAPIIVAPLAGTPVTVGQTVAFQWEQNSDALSYEFYLTDALNGALPVTRNLLPAEQCVENLCSFSASVDLTPSDLHSWHVRAVHTDADTAWAVTALNVITDANTPAASFTINGENSGATGVAPLALTFDPAASSDDSQIVSYAWDFGDGTSVDTTDAAEIIDHTYTLPGTYTASLLVTNDAELTETASATVTVLDPASTVSAVDASRLLAQATFGPTRDDIAAVQTLGIEGWLDEQFTLQGAPHLDYVSINSNDSNRAARHEIWWTDVVRGEDQLRQRVAFALSQILVVSDVGYTLSNSQNGITNYYDMLRDNAFGNYRELLEQVTLSPVMGLYLSMLQNAKGDPATSTRADENFAREVLQLFTIGLHVLNSDGSTDGTPVFDQDQIEAFARVFTGWNYADAGRWDRAPYTGADMINAMRPFESYHDTGPKLLLNGATSPAGLLARQDLEFALDNIFNHPNVGPFVVKQLIKRLVTSNPSPGYVQRIAGVFNNDGSGVRGNLQAVVRALLLDSEARSNTSSAAYGKLREPVLRLSHLWRAFNVQPGTQSSVRQEFNTASPPLYNLEDVTGQAVLRSPSVFNFFQPTFSPAGPVADQDLVAPEFELFTESNELATSNRIGRQIQQGYLGNPQDSARTTAYLDFTYELSLAADPENLIDHLDVVLLSGNLSDASRTLLIDHLTGIPDTPEGLSQRVRDAATLIMASPDYLVQM